MSRNQIVIQRPRKWAYLAQRWEDSHLQNQMVWVQEKIGKEEELPEYVGEFLKPIYFTVGQIYREAYGYDNTTGRLYRDLAYRLPSTAGLSAKEADEQNEKLDKIFKRLPRGFANYAAINGWMQVPEGKPLTPYKAKQLLDFIESEDFDRIIAELILDEIQTVPSKPVEVKES